MKKLLSNKKNLNLVSLFSGGGGLDIGLDAAGFTTRFANDIVPQCCETLKINLKGKPYVICEDIQKVKGADIRVNAGFAPGEEIDVLAGGPPCQAFSIFGQRRGRADPRGQMVYEYFRILSELKMIPILYNSSETAYTSNGLGRLGECTRCVCFEQRNGKYEVNLKQF